MTGARKEYLKNEMRVYDANNTLRVRLGTWDDDIETVESTESWASSLDITKPKWKADWKSFWLGFLLCYAVAGLTAGYNASQIPATTTAGAIYAGMMWAPLNLLPDAIALKLVPEWAFDFEGE